MVKLIAGMLSSSMTVGLCWVNPRSAANWRKYMTSLAQRPRAMYSASQGLRATPDPSAEECVRKGAFELPI